MALERLTEKEQRLLIGVMYEDDFGGYHACLDESDEGEVLRRLESRGLVSRFKLRPEWSGWTPENEAIVKAVHIEVEALGGGG
jgi:hypothetical protein